MSALLRFLTEDDSRDWERIVVIDDIPPRETGKTPALRAAVMSVWINHPGARVFIAGKGFACPAKDHPDFSHGGGS